MFKIVKENSNWITSSLFLLRFRWLLIFIPISVQFFFLIQFLSLITQITIAPKAEILKMFQKISGQLFKESVSYNYFYEKWNTYLLYYTHSFRVLKWCLEVFYYFVISCILPIFILHLHLFYFYKNNFTRTRKIKNIILHTFFPKNSEKILGSTEKKKHLKAMVTIYIVCMH